MFLDNEQTKEYYRIIEANKLTIKDHLNYVEKHHVIPRSLGGVDKKENMVYLKADDHFRCHQLLVEMTADVDNGKMWNALWRMMNKQSRTQQREYTFSSDEYKTARINHARAHSKFMSGENNPFFGKVHSVETKKLMSLKKKGKSYEEIFGKEYAKEMRLKRSAEQSGRIKGPQNKVACPHCRTIGGQGIMNRWHFDNCKKK